MSAAPHPAYRTVNLVILTACVTMGGVALLAPWLHSRLGPLYPACRMEQWFNMPCPLCGLTAGTRLLLTGQLDAAIRQHPLSAVAVMVVVGEILFRLVVLVGRWQTPQLERIRMADRRVHALLIWLYVGYCIAFFACRC